MGETNIKDHTCLGSNPRRSSKDKDSRTHLGAHRRTIIRWHQGIEKAGTLASFLDQYIDAKRRARVKRKVDARLKNLIYKIREENNYCCGQKIEYFLKEDCGIKLGITSIYKILGERYELRSKWKKNQKRGPVPKAEKPREVVQMDTLDYGEIFAFTGVDIFSKETDALLRPSLTGHYGYLFLKQSMRRRFNGCSDLIQTDGGSEFKDEFKTHVLEYAGRHRVARLYKKRMSKPLLRLLTEVSEKNV